MAEQRELNLILRLKDEATKELKGVTDKIGDVSKKVGVAFTAIGGAITAVSALSIKAYQEQERAEKRLETIARQVTGATDEQIESFKQLASQLQAVGVVGDDVVIAGQSQLASFTKNADVVSLLSKDLTDLAVAQYGVSVSQDQAIQTANLMGKALTGQLGALTRTGILVSEEYKQAFEEANDEHERAIVLSKIIADNYGGLNESMRETSEGGVQALKNDLGDLAELLGKELIPVINNVVKRVTPVIATIAKWIGENPKLASTIMLVVAGVGALMLVLGPILIVLPTLISMFSGLMVVLGILTGPIGLVILAIGALIAVGVLLYKNWETISQKAQEIFGVIADFISEKFNAIKDTISNVLNTVSNIVSGTWEAIKQIFTFALALIAGLVIMYFNAMGIDILAVLQSIQMTIQFAWEFIKMIFETAMLMLSEWWGIFWDGLSTKMGATWNFIKEVIGGAWNWITEIFKKAVAPINEVWTNLWDGMKNVVDASWEVIKSAVKASINYIIDQINKVIEAVNRVAQTGAGALGLDIPNIPTIPRLAKGGIVTKPTIAMIGEAGPEAVVPLKGNNGFSGGINVFVDVGGSVISENELAGSLSKILMRDLRMDTKFSL